MPQVVYEMWNVKLLACSKQLLNLLVIQLQRLKSQNAWVFFRMTSNKFFTKSKNVAAKKLCVGVVALEIPGKLTCGSSFCNVVGCKLLTKENLLRSSN